MRERMGTAKVRKLLAWDKGNLISKEKEDRRNKAVTTSQKQASASPQFLLLSMMMYSLESLFGQFWPSVPALSPPSSLPTCRNGQSGKNETSMLCKHYSEKAKALVCYVHYSSHRSKAKHHTVTSIPTRLSTVGKQYFCKLLLFFWYLRNVIYFLSFFS